MSEEVNYRGKLIPVDLGGLTAEEKAREILGGVKLESYYESYLEKLDDGDVKYFHHEASDRLFVMEIESHGSGYFIDLTPNDDGSYDFHTQFYNGGTHLDEMLDEGFAEL